MDIRRRVTGAAVLWVLVATAVVRAQTTDPGSPSTDVTPAPIRASLDGSSPAAFANQIVQPPAGPPATPRHTGVKAMVRDLGSDVKHLPAKENLLWVGIGSGLALAIHPFDNNVNQTLTGNVTAERVFRPGAVLGSLGTLLGTSTAVYAVGRLRDAPKVSHVGMDLIQALAVSEGLTQGLKYATRRERPDQSATLGGASPCRRTCSPRTWRSRGCLPIAIGRVTCASVPQWASSPAAPSQDLKPTATH
jgi:hypothetical protein